MPRFVLACRLDTVPMRHLICRICARRTPAWLRSKRPNAGSKAVLHRRGRCLACHRRPICSEGLEETGQCTEVGRCIFDERRGQQIARPRIESILNIVIECGRIGGQRQGRSKSFTERGRQDASQRVLSRLPQSTVSLSCVAFKLPSVSSYPGPRLLTSLACAQ